MERALNIVPRDGAVVVVVMEKVTDIHIYGYGQNWDNRKALLLLVK